MPKTIDLRSDTLTTPTEAMRQAMAEAKVGDDVFGEDPTVHQLEKVAAAMLGKEAALFVASGTMANLVSQLVHCRRGDEIILGDQSHVFYYEQGGSAAVVGAHSRSLPNRADGTIGLEDLKTAIRPSDVHFPRSRLVILENTHNRCHGHPLPIDYLQEAGQMVHQAGLRLHIDGARIWNAAAALNCPVAALAQPADSVSFCLSKGLCAPIGSLVCGSVAFVQKARRARKLVGGGMRQAGVIAAAGLVALEQMTQRLAEDHSNARRLAEGLAACEPFRSDPSQVKTNIVYLSTAMSETASVWVERLDQVGVRMLATGTHQLRAVTHHPIAADDIDRTIARIKKLG